MFLREQLGARLKDIRLTAAGAGYDKHVRKRLRCYGVPPLSECRRLFSEKLGQQIDWGSAEWASEEWQHDDHVYLTTSVQFDWERACWR
jgi:hypothetical protein